MSCESPVETAQEPPLWIFWRAWEADTVGSRSIEASEMQDRSIAGMSYVRDDDNGKVAVCGVVMMLGQP